MSGLPPVDLARAAALIADPRGHRDLVLVEGAGGLLVRYDATGATIADLAAALDAPALVVTAAGLGTLNHTALTLEAPRPARCERRARHRQLAARPGLAERENLADLETLANGPLAGLLPEGAGALDRQAFLAVAAAGLGPSLGGARGRR